MSLSRREVSEAVTWEREWPGGDDGDLIQNVVTLAAAARAWLDLTDEEEE